MKRKRLRVFADCHVFDGEFQGTRTYLEGLYKELIKHQDIDFFLAAGNVANLKTVFGEHKNVTYISYNSSNKWYRLLIDSPLLLKKHKIDYAHFQYKVPPVKVCKYINTVHDVLFEDFPQYFPYITRKINYYSFKAGARVSEIVFTVSEYSKVKIKEHLGITPNAVTPNGVSDVFYEQYDKEQIQQEVKQRFGVSNYLLFVSRWEPRKNHELILKAFAQLELYKNYTIVYVGDKSIPNNTYNELYTSLPKEVTDKVKDLGRVNFNDMIKLLRGAALFIYPSKAEGFGIPPLEAIAAGVPVISSGNTAMSDFDFLDEYLFDANNYDEFACVLTAALSGYDKDKLAKIQQIVAHRYNWQLSAKVFLDTLYASAY